MQNQKHTNKSSYNFALSQVFSPTLIKRIDDHVHEQSIRTLLHTCGLYPIHEEWDLNRGLSITYQYLKTNYRCEYVYKNEIVNQLLLRYHSDNSATLLRELTSEHSIADIVIINGETVAYEVKTELDRLDRLSSQLASYQQLYDRLNIVTHLAAVDSICSKVDPSVGIIILDESNCLRTIREAGSTKSLFNPTKAVFTLRQVELVAAYEKWEGKLPPMGSALIYGFCHKWYTSLDGESAHLIFAQALKARRPAPYHFSLINDCDPSVRMLFMGRDLSKKICALIRDKLGIFG